VSYDRGAVPTARTARYEVPPPPARPPSVRAGLLEWTSLLALALTAAMADQVTKSIATRTLTFGEPVRLLPFLDLLRIHNPGIAFNQLTGAQPIVVVLSLAAITWMTVFFARSGAGHGAFPVAIGLLLGGALSNFVDRVRNGHVTDFIHVHHFPVFNLADSFISVGVVLLLYGLVAHERRAPRTSARKA
jgi:signal peptidase II